jgi:LacI family transcriptional regulator, gluconate utilization system Gnt-I transcriptional repressor
MLRSSATLASVAASAGVSSATVSRYFSAPEKLSAATVERVRQAVEAQGYVPNLIAGGLASSRSRLIAAIVPAISQSLFASTIQAMTDELAAAGYSVLLGLSGQEDEHLDAVLRSVLGRRPDGIILTGAVTEPETRARLKAAGTPIIETWAMPDDPIDMAVGFSHEEVGRALAARVVETGRRRPLVLAAEGRRSGARMQGFAEALLAASRPEPDYLLFPAPTRFSHGRQGLAQALDSGLRPDAVVCTSDWKALGVLVEAQARGLSVPDDLAVIGFGDLDFAAAAEPALTTVRIDGAAIGRQAAAFLLQRADEGAARRIAKVGFELVVRDSG